MPARGRCRQIHRGTWFTVEDGEGEVVAEEKLAGRAENADPEIDWGVERIPTVCVMEVEVDLPERPRYRFLHARHGSGRLRRGAARAGRADRADPQRLELPPEIDGRHAAVEADRLVGRARRDVRVVEAGVDVRVAEPERAERARARAGT